VLTSDGTSNGVYAESGLIYTGTILSVTGTTIIYGDITGSTITLTEQSINSAAIHANPGPLKTTPISGDIQNGGQSLRWADDSGTEITASGVIKTVGKLINVPNGAGQTSLLYEYSTGTISVTSGSTSIVGSGTTFVNSGHRRFCVGEYISILGIIYKIASVTDDTHLTITNNYAGSTGSGKQFIKYRPLKAGTLKIGKAYKIELMGYYTCANNSTASLTVKLISGTGVVTTLNSVVEFFDGRTNNFFAKNVNLNVYTTGSSGTCRCTGYSIIDGVNTTGAIVPLPCLSDVVINTTVDQILDIQFNWTTNNAANSLNIITGNLVSLN